MTMVSVAQRAGLALLLGLLASAAPLAAAELEEEIINPSEVTFRDGQPYYDDGGDYVRLQTRRVGGELVYFRKVRFDREQGYVDAHGESVARSQARASAIAATGLSAPGTTTGMWAMADIGPLVAHFALVPRATAPTARCIMAMVCMVRIRTAVRTIATHASVTSAPATSAPAI